MKFRVLIQHTEEAARYTVDLLRSEKVKVYDIRETDIVSNTTNDRLGQCYILQCRASKKSFETVKEKWYTTELNYEKFRTLM